jgi:DNA-binding CsgD family transcriptional regulator
MTASWRPPDGFPPGQRRSAGPPLASGKTLDAPRPDGRLVGRESELERIDRLLTEAAAGRAGTLVLEGESGIGKTALLRAAAARARGFIVLTARGIEAEAAVAHGCLLELLAPLRARLTDVPPGQAAALGTALGWAAAPTAGDRFLVAAGTMALLAAAAESEPVLVLVDDVQWIDAESATAILFAARRVHRDRIAFVLAQRPRSPHALDGLEVLPVGGLSAGAATDLLAAELSPAVVERVVERVGGNPLALLEVTAGLGAAERRGAAPLPAVLPIGGALTAVFARELAALSPDARAGLLVLAASRDGRASHVAAALERSGVPVGALDDAERRGLLTRDGDVLAFRHPLLRTAVWQDATAARRRDAHRALADGARTGDVVTRTWHRAQAATGRDDALADDLEELAHRERSHHGLAASSASLERAAALTTDAVRSAERLAAAVTDAFLSGDVGRTRSLASRVLQEGDGAAARATALLALGRLEEYSGSVPAARDLLGEAAELAEGRTLTEALTELAVVQHRLGDAAGMAATAERLAAVRDTDAEGQALTDWVRGLALLSTGAGQPGRLLLKRGRDRMDTDPLLRDEPRLLLFTILAVGWLEDVETAVPQVERRLRIARERGALGVLVTALSLVGYGRAQFFADHVGAFADAGEAVELAAHLGYVADAAPAEELLAWEYAARGRHDEAREHLDRARTLVTRAGTVDVAAHLALTAAFCALCRGDLAATAALLEARIAADGGVGALGEPLGVAPLLVEAYAGSGRRAEAADLAARYAAVTADPLPATAALVARCRALGADGDEAEAAFQQSLHLHAQARDGFETPHTLLLHGQWLRRAGRRVDARAQLEAAADGFAAMDLSLWAHRAEEELRATGRTARPRRPLPQDPLTPQEIRIATLAAEGLPNREIAAALFLSPKTIEHHLSTVYRKRGLRSRAQLAQLFTAER